MNATHVRTVADMFETFAAALYAAADQEDGEMLEGIADAAMVGLAWLQKGEDT